ncbi:restriction endonuclease subunit S [Aeromonas veronii]|uniref:restriction endonuclease subunit S n=1 Tax=Aeromonas veronii TaxID=654 RepID=UPI0008185483|nr:restriction endonuclease subunit S [Aeromonas veronii]OCQ41261.1 type I restriction endonuclease subunit S [Aeromonas veronii]
MAALKIENLITDHLDLWTAAVRPKSSAGRGSNSKLELTGIKKLRELILELAVRGKLVPQDPSDEPASVLLERIAAEKTRLVKEGKIKKPKALPEIGEEDKPFELPEGWECIRLGDLTSKMGSGSTPRGGQSAYVSEGIPFLRSQNVWNEGLRLDDVVYIDENTHLKMEGTKVIPGDVLLNITGASLGRTLIFPDSIKEANVSQHVTIIRLLIDELAPFVHLGIKSPLVQDLIWGRQVGMAIEGLSKRTLELFEFPIPPLAEQQRIVAKVDELMALCDQLEQRSESQLAAHQTLVETLLATLTDSCDADELAQNWARLSTHFDILFTTEASIDALKQTILQLAVMGKLVPQDPSDEPASALLERIAAEKARLVKEKRIKKEKLLPAISEDEKPFELPQGWEWCHLKDIITIMDAGWSPACPPESSPDIDTWGVLKTTAVQTLEYREYENKVLDKTKTPRPEYEVMVGDILITRAGPKNRVGISCLVEKTRPKLMISDKIIRFHLVEVGLSERFISLCLNAGATAVYIDDSKSGMAESQMNISQDKLKLAPIPLGPIKEQNHIMDRVDQLMTLCDQLKSRLQTNQQTQLKLVDSLVEQAF